MNKYWEKYANDYFIHNGKKYYAGTKFTTKYQYGIHQAYFDGYDTYKPECCDITIFLPGGRSSTIMIPKDEVTNHIIELIDGNYYIERDSRRRYFNDSDIPELFFGWIIYIAIMLILFIFKDRVTGWIGATIYFFIWRKNEKEKHVYYEGE